MMPSTPTICRTLLSLKSYNHCDLHQCVYTVQARSVRIRWRSRGESGSDHPSDTSETWRAGQSSREQHKTNKVPSEERCTLSNAFVIYEVNGDPYCRRTTTGTNSNSSVVISLFPLRVHTQFLKNLFLQKGECVWLMIHCGLFEML